MKTAIQQIEPFSSGTDAMCWLDRNCDRCVRAYKPKDWNNPPDFAASKKLVNLGLECKMKLAIDFGFISGEVPIDIAQLVGWNEEDGWPSGCAMFSDDEKERPKRRGKSKPKPPPENQTALF